MSLSFLTYNIHKGIGTDGRFRLDRTIQLLKDAEADIICLQEVDHDVPRSNHQNLAQDIADALDMDYRLEVNVKLKHGAYGNATLSKTPITNSQNFNMTWRIKKKRGCLITEHRTTAGKVFYVYNCHLGLAAFERSWQIHKLLTSEMHKKNMDDPIIIIGDTNDGRHKLTPLMEIGGFQDSCKTRLKRTNFTFPAYAPVIRIDKLFYNENWLLHKHNVIHTKLAKVTSDHSPLQVNLEII